MSDSIWRKIFNNPWLGRGAGDGATVRRVCRCDKNWVRGQLPEEAGHVEGGSDCCHAHKGNVCISGHWEFSTGQGQWSFHGTFSQSCVLKAAGCPCFRFAPCQWPWAYACSILWMEESTWYSGQLHWKHYANLDTSSPCPRWPPEIWDLEPFKPGTCPSGQAVSPCLLIQVCYLTARPDSYVRIPGATLFTGDTAHLPSNFLGASYFSGPGIITSVAVPASDTS